MKLNKTYYLITISYDGSAFSGYQKQKDKLTVQGELERTLTFINKDFVKVTSSGRTDIGVHAITGKVNFSLNANINPKDLKRIINHQINAYIYVEECIYVDKAFHSRFDVKEKTYQYKINVGKYNPLLFNYMLQLKSSLDINAMKKCAKIFIGKHDFQNFVAGYRNNYISKISKIEIFPQDEIIIINVTGDHFYKYMIRNIVGALIEAGQGKIDIDVVKDMITLKSKRKLATASPRGLYLIDVKY